MELDLSSQQAAARRAPQTREECEVKLRILLVEDDLADAHLVMRALNQRSDVAKVDLACDGVQALELIDQGGCRPDLAIVDLKMPRMDGFKLLIEMACRPHASFPIVVLTSSTARNDAVKSRFRGADEVISKPNTFEQLERELSRALAVVGGS